MNKRYEYFVKNIYNSFIYKIYSDCDDVCDALIEEGDNPNDWILLSMVVVYY
jgi:hypothetical protein